ncbi:MAG: hypothetical protein EZS28_016710 [Streblomastix strix]|uniref:TmcB/TmcC TPR repeats domain-containing protein n=1 Tax=Streblomastix strix TaxID=222440 RepID=A0A5J4VYM5_9EUKA|nr:MAG: hypothetical protein EZS28_016710 [Streblomastix strix]
MQVWNLLTRRSVDVDKVEHHIRIGSMNARLAQEQYSTLLIAHSENPNIFRQYSVLMRDVYGDDRLGIEMFAEKAGRAERDEIVAAENMNIALDYSRYCMFSILTLDQDAGFELDAIYDEAQ